MTAPLFPPTTFDLAMAPELCAFAIVDSGLVVLRCALQAHTLTIDDPDDDEPHPEPAVAELLDAGRHVVAAADQLRERMCNYRRALERVVDEPARAITFPSLFSPGAV